MEKDQMKSKMRRVHRIFTLLFVSFIYIVYFANLHFFYDWDTIDLAIRLKDGIRFEDLNLKHLMVPFLVISLSFLDTLTTIKLLTIFFAILLIFGIFKFSYYETKNAIFSLILSFFVLFNFGITFLVTSLEDNIWMNAFLVFFIYYLLKENWKVSAILLSLAILIHVQAAVFLIMFFMYIYLKNKEKFKINEDQSKSIYKIYIKPSLYLLFPLIISYGIVSLLKGTSIFDLILNLTASDYRLNSEWWFFSSNRGIAEQITLVYYGLTSTFVCRFPEFIQIMPQATLFSAIFLIALTIVSLKFFKLNLKTLCALPTFLILFVHSIFYESWNLERWDFLPILFVYFVATSYSDIKDKWGTRKTEALTFYLAILTIIGVSFTLSSFYLMSGFSSNPIYDYADKLSEVITEKDLVIESIRDNSELGLYIKYKLNDKVVFISKDKLPHLIPDFSLFKNIYCSYYTYFFLSKDIPLKGSLVWLNGKNQAFSIMRVALDQ